MLLRRGFKACAGADNGNKDAVLFGIRPVARAVYLVQADDDAFARTDGAAAVFVVEQLGFALQHDPF